MLSAGDDGNGRVSPTCLHVHTVAACVSKFHLSKPLIGRCSIERLTTLYNYISVIISACYYVLVLCSSAEVPMTGSLQL